MERYEKIRVIGQGAFGKVFLCRGRTKKQQQLVVIKQIPLDELQNVERKAARNEVEVLSILKHPNIIAYFDNFVEEKSLMIVMEYAPGGTLFEFIQDRSGVLMEEEHTLQFFVQLLVAIEHIHSQNILHRDLKTQNIMLNKKKTVLKIGDFGISKVLSSKITSAQTVVGTPCYISPEICEGKPYAKKSDIWALGCILYELTTLRKAFEGPNLPALVLKIMQGSVALEPLDSHYSRGLKELIYSLLQRNPDDRPDVYLAMANPFLVNALMNLCTDIGRLPCTRPYSKPEGRGTESGMESRSAESAMMGSGLRKGVRQRSFFEDEYSTVTGESVGSLKFVPESTVYMWGGGITLPLVLPSPSDSRVVGMTCGRSQKAGVTEDGKLFLWQSSPSAVATVLGPKSPSGHTPREMTTKLITGESSAFIKKVSSGDMFYACLTDKGILMTFGSGVNGCLGYGNYDDAPEPKLVPGMLDYETVQVECGETHVVAATADQEVFCWGRGDNGQLGLGSHDSFSTPQCVSLPLPVSPGQEGVKVAAVCCGSDCSLLLTSSGRLLATGNNRFNKLTLDSDTAEEDGEDGDTLVLPPADTDGGLQLESEPKQNPSESSPSGPSPQPRLTPPPLSFLTDTREGEEKPAILKLLDPSQLPTSSFVMSSIKLRKSGEVGVADAGQIGGGATQSATTRRVSVSTVREVKGRIDEALVFRESGSQLVRERRIVAVAMGTNHVAMVTENGDVLTSGDNTYGQLGYSKEKGERYPGVVESLGDKGPARLVACGDCFTIISTEDHKVFSWGSGRRGRLGRETEEDESCDPHPVVFEGSHSIHSIVCSHGNTLLLSVSTPS